MGIRTRLKNKILASRSRKGYKSFPKADTIKVSPDIEIGKYVNINIEKGASLDISKNVVFREFCNLLIFGNGKLTIGKSVFFNNYCSINCLGNISIGENTLFGEGVKLYDHNHTYGFNNGTLNVAPNEFKIGKIVIGCNCWIASNVTILNNVEIGDNVIIGANCLIYKSVPSNSIVKSNSSVTIQEFNANI